MNYELDIDYPVDEVRLSAKRMEARARYEVVDRVPVGFCLVARYFTPIFGIPYREIFRDVETQYRWHLEFAKYRLERIPEDLFCTSPTLVMYPYFDNVVDSDPLGAEVVWPENETLHAIPTIHTVDAMDAWQAPHPTAGLWGKLVEWCFAMKDLATRTRVRFGGVEGHVEVRAPTIGGLSPHMLAIDLVGTDFYWWQIEYPRACHRFLAKITGALIRTQEHFERIWPRPPAGQGLAEDSAQIMSVEQFREFCVPYDLVLFGRTGPGSARGMHMCGRSDHLHESLVNDLEITSFDLFGHRTAPEVAARNLGGKTLLWGNVDPMLMQRGSVAEVKAACRHVLDTLAPFGGLLLGDGANVCPGTPVENLAAFVQTAREYGRPAISPAAGSPRTSART